MDLALPAPGKRTEGPECSTEPFDWFPAAFGLKFAAIDRKLEGSGRIAAASGRKLEEIGPILEVTDLRLVEVERQKLNFFTFASDKNNYDWKNNFSSMQS